MKRKKMGKRLLSLVLALVLVWGATSAFASAEQTEAFETEPMVAAGGLFSLALKSDGTVWGWGYNGDGMIVEGENAGEEVPIQVTNLTSVIEISSGYQHSLALKSNGTVWTWGANYNGQLGNGTTDDNYTPIQVTGLTDVIIVATGSFHSLAVKSDGTVWAWGSNSSGCLGIGRNSWDYPYSSVPVQVADLTDVIAVSAGYSHSLALKSDGTVWVWGEGPYLGDGTSESSYVPVQATGLTDVIAITAGSAHSLALKRDGTVWAWGSNS